MKPRVDYTLYLCTDRELMSTETLEKAVELDDTNTDAQRLLNWVNDRLSK